jgi:hypothetical protein
MPAKNPRLTAVVEKPIYLWLKRTARRKKISLSLLVRDLLKNAYELEEDRLLVQLAEERLKTFDRKNALTHERVWGEELKENSGRGRRARPK